LFACVCLSACALLCIRSYPREGISTFVIALLALTDSASHERKMQEYIYKIADRPYLGACNDLLFKDYYTS